MPISQITPFAGQLPDSSDLPSFDARAQALMAWLVGNFAPQAATIADEINAALAGEGDLVSALAGVQAALAGLGDLAALDAAQLAIDEAAWLLGESGQKGLVAPSDLSAVVANRAARVLHAQHREPVGVNGPASSGVGWDLRLLNTILTNGINGADVVSNQIILPAGAYFFNANSYAYRANMMQSRLYDPVGNVEVLLGVTSYGPTGDPVCVQSQVRGVFTLAATTTLELQSRVSSAHAIGYGYANTWGEGVFVDAMISQLS